MWILKCHKNGKSYYLLVGQTYTVGRKDANILIENDPSISRQHAVLTVTHLERNVSDPAELPILTVHDVGSKYGTFKNGNKVDGDDTVQDGDDIKFGQFESNFSACYEPFVITTSCIDTCVKMELTKTVHLLGGHLVSHWKQCCTHLVMTDIKITVKAVCCLISQIPFVTPEYVSDLVKNLSSGLPKPEPNQYLPPVGEASIDRDKVNFAIVPDRKTIFANKTFIFLDKKQLRKMQPAINTGGGEVVYFSPESEVVPGDLLGAGTCVVQPPVQDLNPSSCQMKILDVLQRNQRKMLNEQDFGLAVVFCSTAKFCNPDHIEEHSQIVAGKLYSQSLTQREMCFNDMPKNASLPRKTESLAPGESIALFNQSTSVQETPSGSDNGKKRKFRDFPDNDNVDQQRSKQLKLENNQQTDTNSINVEGIALCSSSVKDEPQSGDEMEVENNNVSISSPVTIKKSTSVVINSSVEPSAIESPPKHILNGAKRQRLSLKSKVSSPDQKGFLNSNNVVSHNNIGTENSEDERLPKNLIQVEFADLVCTNKPKGKNILKNSNALTNVKNFKKFRKVLSQGARILPQIIGGHELEPYSKQFSRALNQIFNDSNEVQLNNHIDEDEDEAGEFNWESQSRHRKR